jgi:hypothetical protein
MNLLNEWIKLIFAIISLLFFIIQLSLIKPWRKKILKSSGECILKTSSPKSSKIIFVFILCPLLIFFSLITKATTFVCCLMSIIASLACYINAKELVFGKINGIYTNGIIGSSRFILFESIQTFPETSWKNPEKEETTSLAIQLKNIQASKSDLIFIDYESIAEYSKVVFTIKELKQNK